MKLKITNKMVSAGGSSTVVNEQGQDVFFVKGKMFSCSKKKWVRDLKKKKLFLVRNKMFHGPKRSCLIYDAKKKLVAKVIQSHLLVNGFDVIGTKEKITAQPRGTGFPLDIIMGDKRIGTIHAVLSVARDTFELEVSDPADAAFLTAVTIAVDNIRDKIFKKRK